MSTEEFVMAAAESSAALPPPRNDVHDVHDVPADRLVAGRHELVAERGRGAMGVVYKALDHKLDRWVALKFLPSEWSHDELARNRLRREARAASATYHPNVCAIHNLDSTADGQLFIVMAYCDGETLEERLEDGPLPLDEALESAAQIADGLVPLHEKGVVHRDIKPSNLMVSDGTVKILDFGVARVVDERRLTMTEAAAPGTVAYMAPEQAQGGDADERTDIWALGVLLRNDRRSGPVPRGVRGRGARRDHERAGAADPCRPRHRSSGPRRNRAQGARQDGESALRQRARPRAESCGSSARASHDRKDG
jgi:serine/threonine protein kinase